MDFVSSLTEILLIMAVIAAFIAPGYILRKKNLIGEGVLPALSNLLLYVCQPFLNIRAFAVDPVAPSSQIGINMLWVILLAFINIFSVYGVSKLVFRKVKDRKKRDVYSFVSAFSNCGFIGIPFLDIMTGGDGEALMYMAVYNVAFNIVVWTLGVYLMTGDIKDISFKRAFLNPAMIGAYIGLLLFFIPQINIFNMKEFAPLKQIPVYFGCMTSVLSMIIVGARMADIPFKSLFSGAGGYVAAGLKLVISPAIMFAVVLFIDKFVYSFSGGYVWLSVLIASAISPASSCVAYAEKFGGDKDTAAKAFIQGTALSMITLPIMIALLSIAYI